MTDLSAARTASAGWADAEARKISEWGQGEIQRILAQTEAYEKELVAGARAKQAALDASHAGELQKLVENMDLQKAKELKELEDGLQRQMQVSSRCDMHASLDLLAIAHLLPHCAHVRAFLFSLFL